MVVFQGLAALILGVLITVQGKAPAFIGPTLIVVGLVLATLPWWVGFTIPRGRHRR